ncbi:tryptophan synthase subunit alpha [Pusillimonas sp. T7-7]|uniref:tryptophan synthase subunit alpha n=1 Tax=Pusillimonas sp. (strain T7-7) TaxID=1007105 RepID=UPI0002085546|nr:tryptophan synthase subunit alpha [Pusillimonas sp. T7-7]AEC20251.1 tryptophan synthase subunit alpha [Pusillimonas sp. T7-7]
MTASNERLKAAFAKKPGRTALIPYITAGDPSLAATPRLMHALVKAGADVIELGVPFSDPMADGPVIQRAAERAIKRGVGLRQVFDMVAQFRQTDMTTPVVLMGYANPIERMGQGAFAQFAAKAGVDGVLVVDYPPEEIADFAVQLGAAGIDPIFLLAPTSTEARIQKVAQVARGYVYYVSLKGVTGAGHIDTEDVAARVEAIRRHVSVPVGVGFGIRDADSAKRLAECADAVVIGSKLIQTMEDAVAAASAAGREANDIDEAAISAAANWLSGIRDALPEGR